MLVDSSGQCQLENALVHMLKSPTGKGATHTCSLRISTVSSLYWPCCLLSLPEASHQLCWLCRAELPGPFWRVSLAGAEHAHCTAPVSWFLRYAPLRVQGCAASLPQASTCGLALRTGIWLCGTLAQRPWCTRGRRTATGSAAWQQWGPMYGVDRGTGALWHMMLPPLQPCTPWATKASCHAVVISGRNAAATCAAYVLGIVQGLSMLMDCVEVASKCLSSVPAPDSSSNADLHSCLEVGVVATPDVARLTTGLISAAGGFVKTIVPAGWAVWTCSSKSMRVLASEAPVLGKQALADDLQQQLSQAHAREADLQRNVAQLQSNVAQSRQQLQDAEEEHAQVRAKDLLLHH